MTLINARQTRIKSSSIALLNLAWLLILGLPNDMGSLTPFERMQANGQLKVLIQSPHLQSNTPATEISLSDIDPNNVTLALLQTFADKQKVRLNLTLLSDQTTAINYQDYDLIALTSPYQNSATEIRPTEHLLLTTAYLTIDHYLIYRKGDRNVPSQPPLSGASFSATPNSPTALFNTFKAIENRKQRSTVVLSYDWAPYKVFMPKLSGQNMGPAFSLKWGFTPQTDQRLYQLAQSFLQNAQDSGLLTQLQDHFMMLPDQDPLISGPAFTEHVSKRLQDYLPTFKKAAAQYQLDWQLLAAISYQESRWQADAVSPTGVQGLMMLTQDTAADMGIANRQNPTQSIYGAARYLHTIKNRLPDYITEPDRTWMALASYNIGPAHLLRAIRATEAAGDNSANWIDVRQQLKYASIPEYVSKQKYLRGHDQVRSYVTHVRAYYDYLTRPNLFIANKPLSTHDANQNMTVAFNN